MEDSISINLEGWDDKARHQILRTIYMFKHFEFSSDAQDWKWLKIDGACFGLESASFNYYLHPIKFIPTTIQHSKSNGFSIQVCSKQDPMGVCFWFGIDIYQDKYGITQYNVYPHPHAPFKWYD